jgi:hypothetical protein
MSNVVLDDDGAGECSHSDWTGLTVVHTIEGTWFGVSPSCAQRQLSSYILNEHDLNEGKRRKGHLARACVYKTCVAATRAECYVPPT